MASHNSRVANGLLGVAVFALLFAAVASRCSSGSGKSWTTLPTITFFDGLSPRSGTRIDLKGGEEVKRDQNTKGVSINATVTSQQQVTIEFQKQIGSAWTSVQDSALVNHFMREDCRLLKVVSGSCKFIYDCKLKFNRPMLLVEHPGDYRVKACSRVDRKKCTFKNFKLHGE